uniref:TPR type transcription factor n=1 Tax=Catharanthus roseus TaxID=4058 RepID=A0A8A6LNR8_CATRO|nr:TPR type transcription factor [Catharanthus roseus]
MMKMKLLNRGLQLRKALISIKFLLENPRLYCTSSSNGQQKKQKETLYLKISPLGNPKIDVTPVLEKWVEEGRKVRFAELKRIVHDLRKRSRFSHSLQILEWMNKQATFTFSPIEHAMMIDLIGKVHGYISAESYFDSLSEQDKIDKTYGALLHCYVRQRQIEKSLSHLQVMKDKGLTLSPVAYNDIMSLYTNLGHYEKVPDVLTEMKQGGVSPDSLSYRICINSYGQRSDIAGMEKILKEMENQPDSVMDWSTYTLVANFYIKAHLEDKASDFLSRAEEMIDKKDTIGYNHLISLHANMRNKAQVLRLCNLEKNTCRCVNRDYINMLKCIVKIGELEEAKEVLKEWELSGNCYDFRVPKVLIDGYTEKGMYETAEEMLEDLMEKGKAPIPDSWSKVAEGYLDMGEMEKAVECMKIALTLREKDTAWKPKTSVITRLIEFVDSEESKEDANFVGTLRTLFRDDSKTDNSLLTVDNLQ